VDLVYRRPEGVRESVQAIVPGLSETLPARRDRFGAEARRPGGPLTRGFVVPEISKAQDDDITATLARLGVQPTTPRAQFTLRGQPVTLTAAQRDTVMEAVGRERKLAVERVVRAATFGQLSEEAQRVALERAMAGATERVRPKVLQAVAMRRTMTVDTLVSPPVREQMRRERAVFEGGDAARAVAQ